MIKVMQKPENEELRKELASYGAIPVSTGSLMSKVRFGKLASTKFAQMSLKFQYQE